MFEKQGLCQALTQPSVVFHGEALRLDSYPIETQRLSRWGGAYWCEAVE